jgi:hypothetical protein
MGQYNVTTNVNGIPYLSTTNVTVTDEAVNLALGFRRIQPVGYFTVRITSAIPTGTTETLPIQLTLNGTSRPLTFFDGTPVTVADITGTGVLMVFNDRFNGILQTFPVQAAAA